MNFGHSINDFRPLFRVDKTSICGFLNGTNDNPGIKWIMTLADEAIPAGILHPCPYYVNIFYLP